MKKALQRLASLPTPASVGILFIGGLIFTATIWATHIGLLMVAESGRGFLSPVYAKEISRQVTRFPISAPNTDSEPSESIKARYYAQLAEQEALTNDPAELERLVREVTSKVHESARFEIYRAGCYDDAGTFHRINVTYGEVSIPGCNPKKVFAYYIEPDPKAEMPLATLLGLLLSGIFIGGATLLASSVTNGLPKHKTSKR